MKIDHTASQVEDPVGMAAWYVAHPGLTVKRAGTSAPFGHFLAALQLVQRGVPMI
jgi:glyoxylase I family protein